MLYFNSFSDAQFETRRVEAAKKAAEMAEMEAAVRARIAEQKRATAASAAAARQATANAKVSCFRNYYF